MSSPQAQQNTAAARVEPGETISQAEFNVYQEDFAIYDVDLVHVIDPDESESAVVKRMAHRGFTLQALVDFLRRLPTVMPQYDYSQTRTVDVVWHVVIPETRERGCAYADLMSAGQPLLPDKMVSHNWGNLFSHLCAAIFADALGSNDFWSIVPLLQPDCIGVLEAQLNDCGALQRTRWLCIFGVNQHVSICNATWGGEDSVTGEPYRTCHVVLPNTIRVLCVR